MKKKLILIIRNGALMEQSVADGDSDALIASFEGHAQRVSSGGDKQITVEVVPSSAAALQRIADLTLDVEVSLLYLTRGLLKEARETKKKLSANRKETMVIVLTGLFPEDEVAVFDKRWVSRKLIEDAIF
jgi:hypothetical protein